MGVSVNLFNLEISLSNKRLICSYLFPFVIIIVVAKPLNCPYKVVIEWIGKVILKIPKCLLDYII